MPHDSHKLHDLMDRIESTRPKFGDWSTSEDLAQQVMTQYAAQGMTVDPDLVRDLSKDVFDGVERLPTTLPEAYVTPKEQQWRKVGRRGSNTFMAGMAGIMLVVVTFTVFGPDKPPVEVPAIAALIGLFSAMAAAGALASFFFSLLGLPGNREEERRSKYAMRQLLDSSSTCAIEDLLRNPDRTPDAEALALETLRRRQLSGLLNTTPG